MTRMLLCLAALAISVSIAYGQGSDEMYILIDSQNLYPCRNVNPLMQLADRDVVIRDTRGNRVYYIKAPGEYTLHFQNIRVQQPLPNLSGEISATLQVPLFEGAGGIRFDLPYQAIPQQNLLNSQCDSQSGIVQKDGKPYCRYCDLCTTTNQLEQKLNEKHKYLPDLDNSQDEQSFSRICTQVDGQTYDILRTINLPSRAELEKLYKQQSPGVEAQLKQKLDKGRGRLQVYLNLLTSGQPPLSRDDFYMRTQGCRCCSQQAQNDLQCKLLGALTCNRERCKSQYGAQCLQGATSVASCYTAEFNYKVTDKWADVQAFLREHNYPETGAGGAGAGTSSSGQGNGNGNFQQGGGNVRGNVGGNVRGNGGANAGGSSNKNSCVQAITAPNLQRYCNLFWSDRFCCPKCP